MSARSPGAARPAAGLRRVWLVHSELSRWARAGAAASRAPAMTRVRGRRRRMTRRKLMPPMGRRLGHLLEASVSFGGAQEAAELAPLGRREIVLGRARVGRQGRQIRMLLAFVVAVALADVPLDVVDQ